MKKILKTVAVLALGALCAHAEDKLVGIYQGSISGCKAYPVGTFGNEFCADLTRVGKTYQLRFMQRPFSRAEIYTQISGINANGDEIELKDAGAWKLNGKITSEGAILDGVYGKDNIKIVLKKRILKSPTQGMKPPAGAKVLFDGKDMSKWEMFRFDGDCNSIVMDDKSFQICLDRDKENKVKSDANCIMTRERFSKKFKMHIEFFVPEEYEKQGQGSGNSGVYVGPYEIQVLNSFGIDSTWGDCGAIYRMHAPEVNACFPAGHWQTYDIEFTPAKFEGDKCIANPLITVYQNGARIHKDREIYESTDGNSRRIKLQKGKHPNEPLYIRLQDHGSPSRYRNIWLLEE